MTIGFVINPGSGPVEGATAEQAAVNIKQFVADLAVRGLNVVDTYRDAENDYDREDGDGRFAFDLTFDDGSVAQVQMPGLPVDQRGRLQDEQRVLTEAALRIHRHPAFEGLSQMQRYELDKAASKAARDGLQGSALR